MCVLCDRWYLKELGREGVDGTSDDIVLVDAQDVQEVFVYLHKMEVLVEESDIIMGEIKDRGEGDAGGREEDLGRAEGDHVCLS